MASAAPAAPTANKAELLAIADAVAREKLIDKGIVIEAMEDAIQRAARARYGAENDIRAKLDQETGDLRLWRVVEVVEEVEDYFKQVDLKGAQKLQDDAKVGDFIVDPLPPIEFGRIAAQAAKQVIFQKVRDAERERQFEEFKDRAGEVITGVVKRVEFGHIVVDLGRAEGVIRRDQQIPREMVRVGDRIRSLILRVAREARGPQIFLSRAHPDFMKKLFAQEVPEIYDGIIEIRAAARDPGSRAKIGVISHDSSIDPVGACVGMKGSRVQAVVQELQGEKIDIIPWSEDLATFVVNALQPATVSRVVIDEEESRIEVVVPDDQLSLAIGRRGQNVRLASQLTSSQIDILTEQMLVTLGKANIRTLDDLADLATDELIQKKRPEQRRQREPSNRPEDRGGVLAEYALTEEQGNEIIMAARAHWFDDEEPAPDSGGEPAKPEEAADAESSQ